MMNHWLMEWLILFNNKIFQRTHNDLLKERIKILVESQQFEG